MATYAVFIGGAGLVLLLVLILAILTERQLEPVPGGARLADGRTLSAYQLYLNVGLSQLLVVLVLLGLAWWTRIPPVDLGVWWPLESWMLWIGVALGIVLYIANAASVAVFDRLGVAYSEDLRKALAPDSLGGWALLIGVILPLIAISEELLFRAVIIGAVEAGFGISPWLLAVLSAILFALGHGIQGTGGIVVTGTLGLVLAGAFVLTGSLALVVVAHYVVNVLEFVIHEGVGLDWFS